MDFSPDTTRSQSFDQSRPHFPFPASFRVSESATPMSGPGSIRASTTAFHLPTVGSQKYFRSRRIKDTTTISKPWIEKIDKQAKWHTIIPVIGVIAGVALVGLSCWQGYTTVPKNSYCSVYDVDFTTGGQLDPKIWTKEVQLGGFGNGQFDMTTGDDENVFVKDGELWIKPSLQEEKLITKNSVIDLTKQGLCTSTQFLDCFAVTNTTNGTIVNPVKSARINTKKGVSIKYGRIEVVAALPEGDWMWPAIWLLPVEDTYGPWPASGEIDMVESRGNNYTYKTGGNNMMSSALHWGPTPDADAWFRTNDKKDAFHSTFTKQYHKFGLEWSEKYLFTYVDSRLAQAIYVPFNKPLWPKGHFGSATGNGTRIVDPWSQTGRPSTPFDQEFYLILNVAVGSTNSWWTDGVQGKPWVDDSPTAKRDFWEARDQWYPTWKDNGQMKVKSIKMWQQTGYKGCNA